MSAEQHTLLPVTWWLGGFIAVLVVAAAAVAAVGHLGHGRAVLRAGTRGAVQLAAVSFIIAWVIRSVPAYFAFVLVMYVVASRTAGRRIVADRTGWWAGLPIAAGTAPILAALLGTGLVPLRGTVVIPVAGILIGGALTATGLSGLRAADELAARRGEVEAALALGLSRRDAAVEICRPAASTALIPALDQTRTVGLVTLPGAFVGMLLGGASPLAAGAVQMFVLVSLLAVESVAIVVVVELTARGRFTPRRADRPCHH